MAKDKLIATLQQINALVDDAIAEHVGPGRGAKKSSIRRATRPVKLKEPSFNTNLLAYMSNMPGDFRVTISSRYFWRDWLRGVSRRRCLPLSLRDNGTR